MTPPCLRKAERERDEPEKVFRISTESSESGVVDWLATSRERSYRQSFAQNRVSEFWRKIAGGQHVHMHPQQLFQIDLKRAEIQQCRTRQRIDQQVQITIVRILAVQH